MIALTVNEDESESTSSAPVKSDQKGILINLPPLSAKASSSALLEIIPPI